MGKPWGEYGVLEWAWTQTRNTVTSKPRLPIPIPPADLPGCASGEVSWRHWLNWQQANAVTAFSVQLTREIASELAGEGVTPVESWMRHRSSITRVGGGRKGIFEAYGEFNGFYSETRVRIPAGSVDNLRFETAVLPQVYGRYPVVDVGGPRPSSWLAGPYGFAAAIERVDRSDDYDTVRVVSPGYFSRYYRVGTFPGRYLSHWPLDPADEREPLMYPDKPQPIPPRLRRGDLPAVAEYTLAEVIRWSDYLGCRVGETTSGWSDDSKSYSVAAPVTLTVTEAEVQRRALPHTAVSGMEVPAAPREQQGLASYGRSPLVTFHIFNGLRASIGDSDAAGEFALRIAGP